jgi:hypothetical protein
MTTAARTDYRLHFDRAAASFGTEPFSSIQLRERVAKVKPTLPFRWDMVSRWSAPHLEAGRLAVVGTGPKGSLVYRVVGGIEAPPAEPGIKKDATSLTWSSIDALLKEKFAGRSFDAGTLITTLRVAHPAVPIEKARSSVSTCLAYRLKTGALVVVTPGKQKHRWYRLAGADERAAANVGTSPIITEPVPAPAPASPPDPTDALAVALGVWLAETLRVATDALVATFHDREAALQAALREARLARLDELVATLPDHPRLFAAVQEVRRKEAPAPVVPTLPTRLAEHVLAYDAPFTTAFTGMPAGERDQVTKALHLLVHNGSHYPSLATKKVDRPLPGTPDGAWVSRAGDWRFTWEKAGRSVRCHTLFRRGDAVGTYGSEA